MKSATLLFYQTCIQAKASEYHPDQLPTILLFQSEGLRPPKPWGQRSLEPSACSKTSCLKEGFIRMDPPHSQKPIATCVSAGCQACRLQGRVHCHFNLLDFAKFIAAVLPCFLVGALGIRRMGSDLLLPWVAICVFFFGFVEIRVLCSHCPHYAEPGSFLRCWANRGSPKLWKYRPGPLSRTERFILFGGFAAIWGYPFVILLLGKTWLLLIAFVLASVGFFVVLKRKFCSQCMNFACPLNGVSGEVRELFNVLNPGPAEGWKRSSAR